MLVCVCSLYLRTANNSLTGPIPDEVGGLVSLKLLNVENNDMTGTMPLEIADLLDLEVLDLGKIYMCL